MSNIGLIGYPLGHSHSPAIFKSIFQRDKVSNWTYDLFPMKNLKELKKLLQEQPDLKGFNVTIPFKKDILPFLYEIDSSAVETWAVNTVKIERLKGRTLMKGYNTDTPAFEESLLPLIAKRSPGRALVLGNGGAAQAVKTVLRKLKIAFSVVSRTPSVSDLSYASIDKEVMESHELIINCTPVGMAPKDTKCPDIPYQLFSPNHIVYDLIYNPEETLFLKRARSRGAIVKNGAEMLKLQAEKAWEIWK